MSDTAGEPSGSHEGPLALSLERDGTPFAPPLIPPQDPSRPVLARDASNHYWKGAAVFAQLETLTAHMSPDLMQVI